jgi:hypothetical protein
LIAVGNHEAIEKNVKEIFSKDFMQNASGAQDLVVNGSIVTV